jgi:hypothetical protein
MVLPSAGIGQRPVKPPADRRPILIDEEWQGATSRGKLGVSKTDRSEVCAMVLIDGLHHFAYRCRDAEETRHFYEDILGLPPVHLVRADKVPSTGENCPFVHIFFQMADGSHIAFFDLGDDVKAEPSPNTPA